MSGLIAAGVVVAVALAAIWLSPLRRTVLRGLTALSGCRFACRIELFTADQPAGRDQFFRVQMIGRIAAPEDHYPTDVRVEISDITDGQPHPEAVLSINPEYQGQDAAFLWRTSNGLVPTRNAVLARWITVAQIACHELRFACRGRRRLLFRVCVLSSETGEILAEALQTQDYVNCSDGYREKQQRKLEVLQSTLQIAAMACVEESSIPLKAKELLSQWLDTKAVSFPPAASLKENLVCLEQETARLDLVGAADHLLAWGDQADKDSALELSLGTSACCRMISDKRFRWLIEAAKLLNIRSDRFLVQAQKAFLTAGCILERPSTLAGIEPSMQHEQVIKRLNEEYRKWNARVTHPDPQIRLQADRMLTLIADLRSRQLNPSAV
jgi:hypothetical protein